jgi:BirA family biotin operon repressor/biotin-[acetyl-CoA-carboxylase] ligase
MLNVTIGQKIIHLESVDSTNNYAANVFKEGRIEHGTVIMADIQTNGRGQRGNTWQSGAFENLTFSITADIKLWKINSLIDLNRLIALSLHTFFQELKLEPQIKWPNDIMIQDKKVCGILIENFFRDGEPKSVIGIGINVNQKEFESDRATSLLNLTSKHFQPKEVLYKFIENANIIFNELAKNNSEHIHKLYDDLLWKKHVSHEFILNSGSKKTGTVQGTTLQGDLIVSFNNSPEIFRNGEVKY